MLARNSGKLSHKQFINWCTKTLLIYLRLTITIAKLKRLINILVFSRQISQINCIHKLLNIRIECFYIYFI